MGPQPLQNSFMQFTTTAVIVIMSVVWLLVVIVIQSLSIVDIHKLSVRIQFQSIVAGKWGRGHLYLFIIYVTTSVRPLWTCNRPPDQYVIVIQYNEWLIITGGGAGGLLWWEREVFSGIVSNSDVSLFAGEKKNTMYIELGHGGHLGFYEGGLVYPNPVTWLDRALVAIVGGIVLSHHDRGGEKKQKKKTVA